MKIVIVCRIESELDEKRTLPSTSEGMEVKEFRRVGEEGRGGEQSRRKDLFPTIKDKTPSSVGSVRRERTRY